MRKIELLVEDNDTKDYMFDLYTMVAELDR